MNPNFFRLPGLVVVGAACVLASSVPAHATRGADPVADPAVENARPAQRQVVPAGSEGRSRASSRNARGDGSAMTLEAITIEGEIDVPQVLFITARDHLRQIDPLHRLYLAPPAALAVTSVHGSGIELPAVPAWRDEFPTPHDSTARRPTKE